MVPQVTPQPPQPRLGKRCYVMRVMGLVHIGVLGIQNAAARRFGLSLSNRPLIKSTGPQVQIFRAAAGPGQPAMDFSRKEALAKEFMAVVNGLLFK